jgi:hypothetical protein
MADSTAFPGTEMEVIEKYPFSRRLDFPDFGTVCKTTFAKGVIADIKKTFDDPITVEPMVKVAVAGEVGSDYIPIFYHPKAKYWDNMDQENSAREFGGAYFLKSWMSFRVGDEVVVMLSQGKPVVVLGFADGKPKVGENILKVDSSFPTYYFHALRMPKLLYEGEDTGPDGKPLRLTLPVQKITLTPPDPVLTYFVEGYLFETESKGTIIEYAGEGGLPCDYTVKRVYVESTATVTRYDGVSFVEREYIAYLPVIGPILYFINVTIVTNRLERDTETYTETNDGWGPFCIAIIGSGLCEGLDYAPWCLEYIQDLADMATGQTSNTVPDPIVPLEPETSKTIFVDTYAAVYTPELYAKALQTKTREKIPEELIYQWGGQILFVQIPNYWVMPGIYEEMGKPEMFVKPHN